MTRAVTAFRENVSTPSQFWLLIRMTLWSIFLRLLRPIMPIKWLVWLAVPTRREQDLAFEDITRNISWLDYIGLLGRHGNCLPRALVCQRFLTLAQETPTLLIGFDGLQGHAWVEINGEPILEDQTIGNGYRPFLQVSPWSKELEYH